MIPVAFIRTNKLKAQHRRNIRNFNSHHTERDISGAYRGSTRRCAAPPLLLGRGSGHTSASLTARSLTRRRCTAQHSCLLSVSSDLDPASVPSSFVPAQHDSDIPLAGRLFKSLQSQLEVDSNCKKVGFIHVRSSLRDNCDKW